MRPAFHLALQTPLWALAPVLDETGIFDSPSLLVMPLSAALAAFAARGWRDALGMPAAALGLVLVAFSAWTMAIGRGGLADAAGFAAGMVPFHLLGTWLLLGLAWWPARRARAWTQAEPAPALEPPAE